MYSDREEKKQSHLPFVAQQIKRARLVYPRKINLSKTESKKLKLVEKILTEKKNNHCFFKTNEPRPFFNQFFFVVLTNQ
jgi:hypothetical protein